MNQESQKHLQAYTNLFEQTYKSVYAALAFNIHSYEPVFPEVAIQAYSRKWAKGFLELKNGICNYYKFRENH